MTCSLAYEEKLVIDWSQSYTAPHHKIQYIPMYQICPKQKNLSS